MVLSYSLSRLAHSRRSVAFGYATLDSRWCTLQLLLDKRSASQETFTRV